VCPRALSATAALSNPARLPLRVAGSKCSSDALSDSTSLITPNSTSGDTRSHQPGFDFAEARQPAYLWQHRLSGQAASYPQFTDVGVDPVHASSWTRPIGPWVLALLDTATTEPLPDASIERWRPGFIPEARGTRPPVKSVGESQLNYVALPPELMSRAPAGSMGIKASRPLIKLQPYNGSGSLDTFLMKFSCMANNLR